MSALSRFRRFCVVFLFIVLSPASVLGAGQDIGKVIAFVPGASVVREGKTQALALHAALQVSDVIRTDATGRVKILFNDDSMVSLGPNTRVDMREYADSGATPAKFNLHVPQGVIRSITGKIVDKNPEGFKITTPEATVGIRGTLVSLRTGDGTTTVYVENTLRKVYVNEIHVPSGQKITVPDDPIRTLPITPDDRRVLGREFALRGGAGVAAAAPEPTLERVRPEDHGLQAAAVPGSLIPPGTPLTNAPLVNQNLANNLLTVPMGHVAGVLTSSMMGSLNSGSSFSFDVNLSSGAISNGTLAFSSYIGGMGTYSGQTATVNLSGGTGATHAPPIGGPTGSFLMENFASGTVTVTLFGSISNYHAHIKGSPDLRTIPSSGTSIVVDYGVSDQSLPPATRDIDHGTGTGTFTK